MFLETVIYKVRWSNKMSDNLNNVTLLSTGNTAPFNIQILSKDD